TDRLALADALGDADVEGLAVDADADAVAGVDHLQRNRQFRPGVSTWTRARMGARLRPEATTPRATTTAPEHALEKVAEAPDRTAASKELLEVDPSLTRVEPTRRWLDVITGPIAARAQLVVGGPLLWIAQRLIGFVDGLELFLGAGFLADVGMVLPRQAAVCGLDFGVAGIGLDTERLVIVLELHRSLRRS